MYIALEGTVGTGKTTQANNLLNYLEEEYPDKDFLLTREPGGTEISNAIRKLVQGTTFDEEMSMICEAYLYAASRAQAVRTIIKPHLDKGGVVISDRSFITSMAYQTHSGDLGLDKVWQVNTQAIEVIPDYIIFFDIHPKEGLARIGKLDPSRATDDRHELKDLEFFTGVYDIYKGLVDYPHLKDRFLILDATGSKDEVFERFKKIALDLLFFSCKTL